MQLSDRSLVFAYGSHQCVQQRTALGAIDNQRDQAHASAPAMLQPAGLPLPTTSPASPSACIGAA